MKFHCRGLCHKLEGYEKGYTRFAVEGKKYCSGCNYKILKDLMKDRYCFCCKGTYRRTARTDRIKQRQQQIELNTQYAIVALYQKQT